MKKFLSFLFALVLAAGAVTGVSLLASAASGNDDAVMLLDANVTVTSWDELTAAISSASNGDVIALGNDIEIEVDETSSVQYSTVKADITIDLCGHTIEVTGPGYYTGPPTLFSVAAGYTFTLTSSAVDENEQPVNGGIKSSVGTSTRIVTSSGNTANQNNLTWNISNIDIEGFGALNYASMPYALIWYNGSPTETDISLQNVNFKNNNCICISITQDDENTGSTVIKSCSFEDNKRTDFRWALAVYLWKNNSVEVTDSKFTGNGDDTVESTSNGGIGTSTIYSNNSKKITISGCDFENNITEHGGAFYLQNNGEVTIKENTIKGNIAGNYGGGFRIYKTSGPVNITENTITGNKAGAYSGAFYVQSSSDNVNISKNTITSNKAGTYAGGIYITGGNKEIKIENNTLSENEATTYCGGMMLYSITGEVNVKNNIISGNKATSSCAGGIYIQSLSGETNIEENTVSGNEGSYAGGIYIASSATIGLKDNAITGNTANTYAGGVYTTSITNGVTATGNEITGNTAGTYGGGIVLASGSTFTMESGAIYGNTANSYAADVYNKEGSEFTLIEAEDMDVTYYTVKGWYNDAKDARYSVTENPAEYTVKSGDTSGQSLVAAYGCTLSYDAGLGKGTIDSAFMDITKGENSVTISSADGMTEPNGYCRFGSWNLAPDGSDETSYSPDDEIQLTENTTLYAQWEKHNFSTEKAEDETDEDGYKYIEFNWCDDNDLEHLNQITCFATFTCTDCDYTETRDCSVTWEHDEDATCTDAGDYDVKATAHITNPRDGKELTATMDEFFEEIALGHDYGEPIFAWQWDEGNEEWSCETATLECSRDDTAEKTHSLTEECTVTSVPTPATCTEAGKTVYTASVTFTDGTTTIGTYKDSKTVEIEALGHDYGEPIFAWQWDEKNEEWSCETATLECSHDDTAEKTHSLTEECTVTSVTTDPTCTEAGETVYTATVYFALNDNDSYVEPLATPVKYTDTKTVEIAKLGHTPSAEVVIEEYIAPTCEKNGSYDSVIYCEVCSEELSREHKELEAIGHAYGEGVVTKEPTCTEAGELTYTCQNDEEHTYTEEIPANGHTEVTDPAVEPTCTETGLTEGSHCSVCNETIVAQEEIPASGHAYDDGVVTKEPTCTEAGELTYTCQNDEAHTYTEEIPANGHTAVTDPAVEPTCTETGLTEGSHCSVCNETIVAQEEIPALGHAYDDGVVTKEPTCTEAGELTYTCQNDEEHTYTEEIPANGHTAVTDPAVEPTCTEPGLTEGSHCSVCNETIVAQEEIPALGHNLEYTEAKAPSATISGNTEYWYCSVCNKYYADEACTTEISLEDTVIPPTGIVLVPVEVTDVETGEIITVYFDGDTGIYYADSEGTIVIHPDSIILHDGSISVTEEQTTEEVTEQEVTTEGNAGSAENNNGTVNESSEVQLDEEPDEDTEDEENEEEPDEDEEYENGVRENASATSPATGMAADIVGGSLSLAALVAVFAILSRKNKKKDKVI